MKQIKQIILSFFVLFVFLANFNSLNSHIIYIMGSTTKPKIGKKIYDELKEIVEYENINYFMKSKATNRRKRSNTTYTAYDQDLLMSTEFVTGQWSELSKLIKENYAIKNITSDLVIFGDISNLLTSAISNLLQDTTSNYKYAIGKIVQLIPPKENAVFPSSQSIDDLFASISSDESDEENLTEEEKEEEMEKDDGQIMSDDSEEMLSKTITIQISKSKTIFESIMRFGRKLIRKNKPNLNIFVANQILEELKK